WSTLISTNDSTFGNEVTMVAASNGTGSYGWFSRNITSLITSQAALDGLRAQFKTLVSGSSPAASEIDAAYLEVSVPGPPPPLNPGWSMSGGTDMEIGAWSIGNVTVSGGAHIGGSVFVDKGTADLSGGSTLKAFATLPSGAPTSYVYTLGTASNFNG